MWLKVLTDAESGFYSSKSHHIVTVYVFIDHIKDKTIKLKKKLIINQCKII